MTDLNLHTSSAPELLRGLRSGQVCAIDLCEQARQRHQRFGEALNAYKLWLPETAREQAIAADAAFRVGVDLGPAQGLPMSIKDVFGVRDTPTYCGTARRLPVRYEAEGPLVAGLRRQFAVFPGKAHTVPFALGVLGVNQHWGAPRNPWDAREHRLCGGSSSGAGGSLWEGSCLWALGSDAGGSVRAPAALTGCVGLRTSIGRWPKGGELPLAPTLDTPGLLARSVEDLLVGFAAIDPTAGTAEELLQSAEQFSLAGLRIGIAREHFYCDCGPGIVEAVEAALARCERLGATLVPINIAEAAPSAQWMANGGVNVTEVHALVRSEFPDWIETLDPTVWSRLSTYGAIDTVEYLRRLREIEPIRQRAHAALAGVDLIAAPASARTAPRQVDVEDMEAYRVCNMAVGRNLMLMNLWDFPALVLPVGKDPLGLPIGLQLASQRGSESFLLHAARAVERAIGNARQVLGAPPLCP